MAPMMSLWIDAEHRLRDVSLRALRTQQDIPDGRGIPMSATRGLDAANIEGFGDRPVAHALGSQGADQRQHGLREGVRRRRV